MLQHAPARARTLRHQATWANMVSNFMVGDKAQIRHQAARSALGCSRPRWNCRPVALVSSCKPFLSTQQLPRHNATLKCSNVLCTNVSLHTLPSCSARSAMLLSRFHAPVPKRPKTSCATTCHYHASKRHRSGQQVTCRHNMRDPNRVAPCTRACSRAVFARLHNRSLKRERPHNSNKSKVHSGEVHMHTRSSGAHRCLTLLVKRSRSKVRSAGSSRACCSFDIHVQDGVFAQACGFRTRHHGLSQWC